MAAQSPPNQPPGPDVSIVGSRCLGPLIPIQTICLVLLALRLYTRARPVMHLAWDDAAVAVASMASVTQFAIFIAAVPYGVGRHSFYINPEDASQARRLLYFSQLPSGWSVALGKISIALLLLRLKTGRGWRIFLYAMVAVQLATAVHANAMQLAMCRPTSAGWRLAAMAGHCWPVSVLHATIYAHGSVAACTDLVFALIPLTFLGSVRRSVRERLVIALLMGLGVFAAAAVVIKLTLVHTYGAMGDMLWDSVDLNTWSILEGHLGIVAACLPCLKSPFQAALRRMGLLSDASRDWENCSAASPGLQLYATPQTPCSRTGSEIPRCPDSKV
ncbi:hypothetical protein OQA88_9107 [Cercophora sp. LCS_1]